MFASVYLKDQMSPFPNQFVCLSPRIVFILTNIVDPKEMPQRAAFYQGLHCLQKYPFRGFQNTKG